MLGCRIALFGEAEKGEFCTPYFCKSLAYLSEFFGNPPPDTRGLHLAVQVLLFQRDLIFFRVREEGFSVRDYLFSIQLLHSQTIDNIAALCAPGVGNSEIINPIVSFCQSRHSLLIISQADLYDYLTSIPRSVEDFTF